LPRTAVRELLGDELAGSQYFSRQWHRCLLAGHGR
jgi:hypothetical protein